MSEQALGVFGGLRTTSTCVSHDGLAALERSLPGCPRRYLLVDFTDPHPFVGRWRSYRSAVDVIVLRGEVRLEWAGHAGGSVVVGPGEHATVVAGCRHRLLVDAPALFELYVPAGDGEVGR